MGGPRGQGFQQIPPSGPMMRQQMGGGPMGGPGGPGGQMPPGMSPEMQQRMRFQGQMPPNPMMGPGGPNQQGPHPNQINGPNSK